MGNYITLVSALLSRQDAQSFINHQDEDGLTPLHFAGSQGHEAVTKQLIDEDYVYLSVRPTHELQTGTDDMSGRDTATVKLL